MSGPVRYSISGGKITATYEDGTVADFGSDREPYKSVMATRPDGEIMVCTMPESHWAQLREKISAADRDEGGR